MRKDFADIADALRTSVTGIAASGADDRETRLAKSLDEFEAELEARLDEYLGPLNEPLRKGLNHIQAFATALATMNRTVNALKTGRPSWLLGSSSDDGMPAEELPEDVKAELDRFMALGVLTLREMVNNSAELPDTDDDLVRAERAGCLAKIADGNAGEFLVITDLPMDLREYLAHPLELMLEKADLGCAMMDSARDAADELSRVSPELITQEIAEAYPEIFEVEDGQQEPDRAAALLKALMPPQRRQTATTQQNGGGQPAASDTIIGDGGDPNDDALDPSDTGLTDDVPTNPLEIITRLATIITVIGGSLLQGSQGAGADTIDATDPSGSMSDDTTNVGLQRSIPIAQVPLQKILAGEVAVEPSLADALEELLTLRKRAPQFEQDMEKLRKKVAELQARPVPAAGVARIVVDKSADGSFPGMQKSADTAAELARLASSGTDPDGDAASRLLIKQAHMGGGRPLVQLPGG
jgi:hypothetical protein